MIASTVERVPRHTPPRLNRRIRRNARRRVDAYRGAPRAAIRSRIAELDREWDIERILQANAASLALAGSLLGAFVSRAFLILPAAVAAFLLQHAVQGWCPPLPLLRRLGARTPHEIAEERFALRKLRR